MFCFLFIFLLGVSLGAVPAFAQAEKDLEDMFNQAREHVYKGEYRQAITIYDDILEVEPDNISTLKMKGIVHSNLQEHDKSLRQFFKILQYKPNDVISLTGMGVGFGNLGEYQESLRYFQKAHDEKPNSIIIKNYIDFINSVIIKYPYTPTEKPQALEKPDVISVPKWVKNNAGWWADKKIGDEEFVEGIQYLIENGIITISTEYMFQKSQEELEEKLRMFKKYLRDISTNISNEKRYIEFPNPSQDVIKKFLRDYARWNFEDEVKRASGSFPNPTYEIDDGVYIIHYKVFINEQPTGLPLDHVGTLKESFMFWEEQELTTNDLNAKIKFEVTNLKQEANVWVTWVVRNIGDGVLGHAHIGKGVVEVTLGDYNCDGSFQLYDVKSVETIMTHELGHSIGLQHVKDKTNIMYPSFAPGYAYCLLG